MLPEIILTTGESEQERLAQGKSKLQQNIDRNKQEQKENSSLIGSVAKTLEKSRSTQPGKSTLYIIGDYLYNKSKLNCSNDGKKVLYLLCKTNL